MTTDSKLLAQDDIDALLGEAGLEGNYNSVETKQEILPKTVKKKPIVRFSKKSDLQVQGAISVLRNKALIERDDDVKVIWNALGTIPMVTGYIMKIQEVDYESLGILYDNHLVVKNSGG